MSRPAALLVICLVVLGMACRTLLDVTAPTVEILSPIDGARLTGEVVILVRARDENLKQVHVYMDDDFIHENSEDSFAFTCTIPDTNRHTIKAKATDLRGNWSIAQIMVNPVAEFYVTSTPAGASVWLDGRETGESTNCLLTDISVGFHFVKLTRGGYFDWEDTVTTVYRERVTVNASLVADIGALQINSTPTDAVVWIDGQSTGYTTNCLIESVPTGVRTVKLTKTDHQDWVDTVTVQLNGTVTVDALLTYVPYPDTVIAEIPVGDYPRALAWNATNNRLYCANLNDDNVSIIDGVTNQVTGTVGVGTEPVALCWNESSNRIYCANNGSSTVTVVDGASGTYVTTIAVGDGPVALTWSGRDNKVFCANYYGNSVTVIDGVTNQVDTTIALPNSPLALAWNRTDNKVYCGYDGYCNLTVIDGSTGRMLASIRTPQYRSCALAWNETDNCLYVAHYSSVTVVDCTSGQVITTISGLRDDLSALVWNKTNNKVYCLHNDDSDDIEMIDCMTNSVIDRLEELCLYTRGGAYNHTQNRIYYTCYRQSQAEEVRVLGTRQP